MTHYATKIIAAYAYRTGAKALFALFFLGLTACASLQPAPRALVYDFGPGALVSTPASATARVPALVLAEVQAASALDGTALLYRLAYSDAQQLRPYAQARWSMPPAELLRQRLREQLGQSRAVVNSADGLHASGPVLTLRVDLDEFSQLFEASDRSVGLLRLRATLTQTAGHSGTEKLLTQRSFVVQRPSPSQDAAGGVRALTAAAHAVGEEIDQWIQQAR